MKKVTLALSAFLLLFVVNTHAQQSVIDNLNEVIDAAEVIRLEAKRGKAALKTLAVDYFVNNNPNPDVDTYIQVINLSQSVVEEYSDEVNQYIYAAAQGNPAIDPSSIASKASQIEGNEDFIYIKSGELKTAIEQDNRSLARTLNREIRNLLKEQISLAKEIKEEAEALKNVAQVYNVRIELVDERTGASVPVGTLPGYATTNLDTGEIFYAGANQGDPIDEFYNLPVGSYRFDAYDGYFDGASSSTVDLTTAAVGSDGFIVVTLHYWSE